MIDEKEEKEPKEESKEQTEKERPKEDSAVKIPEEFQRDVYELVDDVENEEQANFIRTCLSRREDEMRKAKEKKESKGKRPKSFSTAEMPMD